MDKTIICLIIILAWIVVMVLIMYQMPESKIAALGDFFAKVLPKIPLTEMIKVWRKGEQ